MASSKMLGRVVIFVVGFEQPHWRCMKESLPAVPRIDVRSWLPWDPEHADRSLTCTDSVVSQDRFHETVFEVVMIAKQSNKLIVGCKRGKHRSPVTAVGAKEILMHLGYSVAIMEMNLVQPDLIKSMIFVAEDMSSGVASI